MRERRDWRLSSSEETEKERETESLRSLKCRRQRKLASTGKSSLRNPKFRTRAPIKEIGLRHVNKNQEGAGKTPFSPRARARAEDTHVWVYAEYRATSLYNSR